MDCPVCREPMIIMELDAVEIDHCLDCRGIWLDGGELEILLEGSPARQGLLDSLQAAGATGEALRRCPICRKKMEKVWFGSKKSILIDRCPRGDGLWFDQGELEKAVTLGSDPHHHRVLDLLKGMFPESVPPGPAGTPENGG